ncbi:MAG: DUF3052 family protein [Acidobacteria bacterium]|nr:DUF3052 family protein [Acidobacteriota bacterium]
MGLEANCTATYEGTSGEGKALLETSEFLFRGAFSLRIPLKEIQSAEARRGELQLTWTMGSASFALGKDAEKWALKIRYPRGRLEKLGVKEGMRVAVLGVEDPAFHEELLVRIKDLSQRQPKTQSDIIFLGIESKEKLSRIEKFMASIKPAGAIWTVYPKGQKHITQNDVMTAGKAAGLVDTKVVGFSETHSALKWVIPVAKR